MSDIEGVIQGLHGEGVLTSEGRFTISLERAAKARFKLLQKSPAWPFLQMVQEAHRRQASRVKLKTGHSHIHFSFACEAQPQWWSAVEWLAHRPVDKPSSLVLAEVLLALMASGPEKLELVLVNEHEDAKLTWTPDQDRMSLWGACALPTQLHITASYARRWWHFGRVSYPAKVQVEVGQRCRHALIPIELDSLLINDADWSTLPGLSYLPPEFPANESAHLYNVVAENLNLLGTGFIAPSTRLTRPLEFQFGTHSLRTKVLDQCNAVLLVLENDPQDLVRHFTSVDHFPKEGDVLALHPTITQNVCLSQQFLVSRRHYLSQKVSRNCGYLDLEKTPSPYLEVSQRVLFPVRAPFVSQLSVIQQGVALEVIDCDLGIPGTVAVVSDERLVADADGCKPVRDATFEELRRAVAKRARHLAAQLKPWLKLAERAELARLHPAMVADLENRFSGRV